MKKFRIFLTSFILVLYSIPTCFIISAFGGTKFETSYLIKSLSLMLAIILLTSFALFRMLKSNEAVSEQE